MQTCLSKLEDATASQTADCGTELAPPLPAASADSTSCLPGRGLQSAGARAGLGGTA